MKRQWNFNLGLLLATGLATILVAPVLAESKNKLEARVRDLTDYFDSVQKDSEKAVPAEILSKAQGLVIMRNYKAGFIFNNSGNSPVLAKS